DSANRSNPGISSLPHNNKGDPETRAAGPDASGAIEYNAKVFRAGDCHKRPLCPEIFVHRKRATLPTNRYRARGRQFARRSSRANSSQEGGGGERNWLPAGT